MNSRFEAAARSWPLRATAVVMAGVVAVSIAGCGDKKKDKPASQIAAKVNKEEISVHQINYVLQRQPNLKPEQAETASKQVLERLIDQELALQKAAEMKVDRDPRVVQQVEMARRDIVARAYMEKIGEAAAKPTAEEVKAYYDAKPALFKERRIYTLQELLIEAKPEQIDTLRKELEGSKNVNEFVEYLKANGYRFAGNQQVRSAEQLPLNAVDTFAKMKDGQAMLLPNPAGAQVVVVAASRMDPVDEVRARPVIEQFLLNESKRKLIDADIKAMRSSAKVEYVGKFADAAPGAASAPAAAAPAPAASTSPDAAAISKGVSGLK